MPPSRIEINEQARRPPYMVQHGVSCGRTWPAFDANKHANYFLITDSLLLTDRNSNLRARLMALSRPSNTARLFLAASPSINTLERKRVLEQTCRLSNLSVCRSVGPVGELWKTADWI